MRTEKLILRLGRPVFLTIGLAIGMVVLVLTADVRAAAAQVEGYRLGAGDRIRVTVFGHPDLSGEFEVDGTGHVALPLIRTVPAQGLTVFELGEAVAERLSPDYLREPQVSVEVLNYRPFYIYGEVNNPGSYPYVSGMSVINAVALAGGFTYRARQGSMRIKRAGETEMRTVDPSAPVFPGDVIEVRERYF